MTLRRYAKTVAVGAASFASISLQGCGGGGGETPEPTAAPTPSPPTSTTITTYSTTTVTTTLTTTTTMHPRTKPMTAQQAADYFNQQYKGYDKDDENSPLGITLSMAAQHDSFFKNIFCSDWAENPHYGRTGCSMGRSDCRLSTSIINHKMMVSATDGTTVLGFGRSTGYIFNQTMVESEVGKCAYLFDGASDRRYNNGCGGGAAGECPGGAFANICKTGKVCTAEDEEVERELCQAFGGTHPYPPTHSGHSQCYVPLPAFTYYGQEDWTPGANNLREMVNNRVANNDGHDFEGPNIEKWNEIVIDERLLLPKIWYDPAVAIPAFFYNKGSAHNGKASAIKMRDDFCKYYQVEDIPVIGIDADRTEDPFVVESTTAAIV